MTAVVVTADDFGLCAEINAAICLLHDRGIVRRTSLLVNTPSFESSVEALRQRPTLEVAIHLNLTDGRGGFRGGRHYGVIAGIVSGRVRRLDIHREWRAQIVKARSAGVALQELNSHGHLHLLPRLHDLVMELRREFDIPRIRLVRSLEWPRGVLLQLCSRRLLKKLRRDAVPAGWPDRTLGLRIPGAVDHRIRLRDLAMGNDSTAELIVHPSQGANEYHNRWGYSGDDVLNWLLSTAAP